MALVIDYENYLLFGPVVGEMDVYLASWGVLDCVLDDVDHNLLYAISVTNGFLRQQKVPLLRKLD